MKQFIRISFCILIIYNSYTADAQFYYSDIVSTQQNKQQYLLLKQHKIQKVKATSLDADGTPDTDFSVEQAITKDAGKITTTTQTSSGSSTLQSYYANGLLIKTENETNGVSTTTHYIYNNQQLLNITSTTVDTSASSTIETIEQHVWKYKPNGQVDIMYKVKNAADTTNIEFVVDDAGNVVEELWTKGSKLLEHYYYYYNDKNQLTDIVRYNSRAKKLLPDFVYEYNAQGLVTQLTAVKQGGSSYTVWKYTYNDKGLRTKEVYLDKKKQLIGSIEYTYN